MKFLVAAAAVVGQIALAPAGRTVVLHPGQSIVVRIDNGMATVEQSSAAEPMTKYEVYTLWRAESEEVPPGVKVVPPGYLVEGEGPPSPPHPSGNLIEITMRQGPGLKPGSRPNTALFITNGYASALRYSAAMIAGGRSTSTDVCSVAPHLFGLEHWPYPIDELDLSDLRLEPSDGTTRCQ